MKLRMDNNSVRFRLSVQDLSDLTQKGIVSSCLWITSQKKFKYSLLSHEKSDQLSTDFIDDEFLFYVPEPLIRNLNCPEEIGIYGRIVHEDMSLLQVIIEKDFKCLTARGEDESFLFPNPNDSHST